ncbi:hypothetical protein IFO69_18705 [Echinicola sp. CAU 1574]|uniref:Lipoprotein n=1 Tax=Echinicola arenosa TaxID=2774144 RepID=A0ABR9AT53_9BACT|nr:hypothetical protein [Echinicola arenosa]MBD8490789.1 hypothetical protein [Echinicola arenosa]
MNCKLNFVGAILATLLLFFSCTEETVEPQAETYPVVFGFRLTDDDVNARKQQSNMTLVVKAIITITNEDGSPTNYTKSELEIYEDDGIFYSDNLYLNAGKNIITRLRLVDGEGTTLFAIPEDVNIQKHVNKQLPITINVEQSSSTRTILLDIISTLGMTPEEFGYDPDEIHFKELKYFLVCFKDEFDDALYVKGELYFGENKRKYEIDSVTKIFYNNEDGKLIYEDLRYYKVEAKDNYSKYFPIWTEYFDHMLEKYRKEPLEIVLKRWAGNGTVDVGDFYLTSQEEVDEFGAKKLDYLIGNLTIDDKRQIGKSPITNLTSISRLLQINGNLTIKDNPYLESLDGMILNDVEGDVVIEGNDKLISLDGLWNFKRLDGTLVINNNSSLTSFCGITKLFHNSRFISEISGNAFNPTAEEIGSGECSIED